MTTCTSTLSSSAFSLRATARLRSFSSVPSFPTAPPSRPPCPGSITTVNCFFVKAVFAVVSLMSQNRRLATPSATESSRSAEMQNLKKKELVIKKLSLNTKNAKRQRRVHLFCMNAKLSI